MTAPVFAPGFRLSVRDCIVLVLGAIGSAASFPVDPAIAFYIAFVVGHFFLFCNVLRMPRDLELVWAATFVGLAAASLAAHWLTTWQVALAAGSITVLIAVTQARRPSYHGVFWRRFNPNLEVWWRQTHQHR
jgi:hypothetical protein